MSPGTRLIVAWLLLFLAMTFSFFVTPPWVTALPIWIKWIVLAFLGFFIPIQLLTARKQISAIIRARERSD